MCGSCLNRGEPALPIEWPRERALIVELLTRRPDPATRNWLPGEPVDRLWQENREHGVPA